MNGLQDALAALAKETPAAPPPVLKENLMAEFRRAHRRPPIVKWVVLAAAAVLVLALWLTPKPHEARKPVARVAQPAVASATVAPVAPVVAAAKVFTPPKRRRVRKTPTPTHLESAETATDFFAIPFSEPLRPEERADVFRVEMPRANMAAFGLPVAGGHLDARIEADVLVGEDGVMRAIRFVH